MFLTLSFALASLTITYYTDIVQSSVACVHYYCFREKHHDQSNELDYRRACIKIIPYLPRDIVDWCPLVAVPSTVS